MEKQIRKLTITKVYATDKKKDGTLLINKWGKPYWRVGIKAKEMGEEWLNGFMNYDCKDWTGQVKELEVWQEEYEGKMQWKFALVVFKITKEMWDKVVSDIENLRKFLVLPKTEKAPDEIEYPEEASEDIPF